MSNKTKIALMGCPKVESSCPSVVCNKYFMRHEEKVKRYGKKMEMVASFTCPGCPGIKVEDIAIKLKEKGVDIIHIVACLVMEDSYSRCPHLDNIKNLIKQAGIKTVDGVSKECVRHFRSNSLLGDVIQAYHQQNKDKSKAGGQKLENC